MREPPAAASDLATAPRQRFTGGDAGAALWALQAGPISPGWRDAMLQLNSAAGNRAMEQSLATDAATPLQSFAPEAPVSLPEPLVCLPEPQVSTPVRRSIGYQGRDLSDDPVDLATMLSGWAASGGANSVAWFIHGFRQHIEQDRQRLAWEEEVARQSRLYPTDVSGVPEAPETALEIPAGLDLATYLELENTIAAIMETWLDGLNARVAAFHRLVIVAAQVRLEQNRQALTQWREFIERQLPDAALSRGAMAEGYSELLDTAQRLGREEQFELWARTRSPALSRIYERAMRGEMGACQYCHEIKDIRTGLGEPTQTPRWEIIGRVAREASLSPAVSPPFSGPSWLGSEGARGAMIGNPATASVVSSISRIGTYLELLGPRGYQVLPPNLVSRAGSPAELRGQIVSLIEERREKFRQASADIGDPDFDWMLLHPEVRRLLPLADPDVQGTVQENLRQAQEDAEARAHALFGIGLVALLLTIFPPTSEIGIAIGVGLSLYGIHEAVETLKLADTLKLTRGSTGVFDPEQQEAADAMTAMAVVQIVLGALDLGAVGVSAVRLVRSAAAEGVLEGVTAEAGTSRIEVTGLSTENPTVRVTGPDGAVIREEPLLSMEAEAAPQPPAPNRPQPLTAEPTGPSFEGLLDDVPGGDWDLQGLPSGPSGPYDFDPFLQLQGGAPPPGSFISATAQTPRSMITSIRATVAEGQAAGEAVQRGEWLIEAPGRVNVGGRGDFITARRASDGRIEIICNDSKASTVGRFPAPRGTPKPAWMDQVRDAVAPGRLDLGDRILEREVRAAYAEGRVRMRQIETDYTPIGGLPRPRFQNLYR